MNNCEGCFYLKRDENRGEAIKFRTCLKHNRVTFISWWCSDFSPYLTFHQVMDEYHDQLERAMEEEV